MNLSKSNVKKICGIILFTVVVFLAIQNLDKVYAGVGFAWGIVFPFALGGMMAFVLNVPMSAIEKHLFKRWITVSTHEDGTTEITRKKFVRPLSILITVLLVLAVICAVVLIVVPRIGTTTRDLLKTAESFFPKVQTWAENIFENNSSISEWIAGLNFDVDKYASELISFLKNGFGDAVSVTFSAAKAIASGITSFVIGIVFACYILAKKETLLRQINMLLDAVAPAKIVYKTRYVMKLVDDTFSSFISGQCIEALILGSMFFVTLTILRLPYPMLIGVLIAFTALIPIFGAFIGCIIGTFLTVMVSPVKALVFLITFLVLQQIEGNLIYPRVVGGSVGLPSLWVLAAVTIGGSLLGVAGMLLFLPLTSVIYTLLREWTYKRLEEKRKEGKL